MLKPAAMALMLALSTTAFAAGPDPALLKEAAATAGGQIFLGNALEDSPTRDIVNGFNAAFADKGLHVKSGVRYQSAPMVQLYDQELRANKVTSDVLIFVDPALFLSLSRAHKLTPYCSANFADYRPEALTPNCDYFVATAYEEYIGYNPTLVQPADIPTSWMGLVNPKFAGNVSIPDPKVGGGFYYFVFTMYKLFGKDWFVKARANNDLLANSHGVMVNQILSGERAIAVAPSYLVRTAGPYPGGKNGPIKEAFPSEGGPMLPTGAAITKGGPNPAGAKIFIDWLSSLPAQQIINHNGLFSLRKDFTSREGDDLAKIHYLWFDPDEWTNTASNTPTSPKKSSPQTRAGARPARKQAVLF